jgi:hypothetical protein
MANPARYKEVAETYETQQLCSNDSLAAAVCLRYLSMQFLVALKETPISSYSDACAIFESDVLELDLLHYATTQWFEHLKQVEEPEQLLFDLVDEFLDEERPNLDIIWRLFYFSGRESPDPAMDPGKFSAIQMARYFGLRKLSRHLSAGLQYDLHALLAAGRAAGRPSGWWPQAATPG